VANRQRRVGWSVNPSATQAIRPGSSPDIMRALEAEVVEAVWAATEPLLPTPPVHPLGCHRPRVSDRLCLWALLIRLTTGASWVDIKAILDDQVPDTTLRARRDEWIAAGVFEQLRAEALAAFDRIVGLDLSEVAIDGSLHKAPYGGAGERTPATEGAPRCLPLRAVCWWYADDVDEDVDRDPRPGPGPRR
jgi:transposase